MRYGYPDKMKAEVQEIIKMRSYIDEAGELKEQICKGTNMMFSWQVPFSVEHKKNV